MLENLSQQVRDCLRLAEECGNNAKVERDPGLVRDFLDMERRYLSLARVTNSRNGSKASQSTI